MHDDHIFHEYIRQNNGLMNQIQELVLSLSKSFQGLNAQHQQLAQRVQTSQHRSDLVFYTLLRHNEALREQLRQTLERATNPFPEESPEYLEFDSAIASLRAMLKQCQRAATMRQTVPKRTLTPQIAANEDLLVECVQADDVDVWLDRLAALLRDAVNGGASLGFLPPVDQQTAERYWHDVQHDMRQHAKDLLIARQGAELRGAVQLAYASKPNAQHRAEIQKLSVHSQYRRQGIAQRLMQAAENLAQKHAKTLLVLDTRVGDAAEQLYLKLGYHKVGEIPGYTQDADGRPHDTVFFYKKLSAEFDQVKFAADSLVRKS